MPWMFESFQGGIRIEQNGGRNINDCFIGSRVFIRGIEEERG